MMFHPIMDETSKTVSQGNINRRIVVQDDLDIK
jgi:hypothetical protein